MASETFGGSPPYIASQQSVDFAAMSAGSATVQVTVEGAKPGDGVLIVKPGNTVVQDSMILEGYCDTVDKVDIVVLDNDETATDNLAAVTLTIIVFPA